MRSPTLSELPAPPPGKEGWPWTVEAAQLRATMPDGSPWPRISIVTPSFNQGRFIEETIRSILLQGYQNLEYFIMDGGSSDESMSIISKYSHWLTFWVSEQDRGQAHAINKALALANGDIFQWVNSDDYLTQNSLETVALNYKPDTIIAGDCINFSDTNRAIVETISNRNLNALGLLTFHDVTYHQPGVWVPRGLWNLHGKLEEDLYYAFDWIWTIKLLSEDPSVSYIGLPLVYFRLHSDAKTCVLSPRLRLEQREALWRLSTDPNYPALQAAARQAALCRQSEEERIRWHERVAAIRSMDQSNAFKALRVTLEAFASPSARLTRFTLGQLRRLLFSASA